MFFKVLFFTVHSSKLPSRGQFYKVEAILLRTETKEDYDQDFRKAATDEQRILLSENAALIKVRKETQKYRDNQNGAYTLLQILATIVISQWMGHSRVGAYACH